MVPALVTAGSSCLYNLMCHPDASVWHERIEKLWLAAFVSEWPNFPHTIPYKYKPNYFNTLAYTIYIVTWGKKKIKIPSRKEKSLSQISYVIIMQKIILVSLCMYAKNNLIPRICFYPEVGISKRKSWQFSAERSEEKLETDPSPSYQLVVLLLY